jgi:hypothetical protein
MPPRPLLHLLDATEFRCILQRLILQESIQILPELSSRLVALRWIGGQALANDTFQTPGNFECTMRLQRGDWTFPLLQHGIETARIDCRRYGF